MSFILSAWEDILFATAWTRQENAVRFMERSKFKSFPSGLKTAFVVRLTFRLWFYDYLMEKVNYIKRLSPCWIQVFFFFRNGTVLNTLWNCCLDYSSLYTVGKKAPPKAKSKGLEGLILSTALLCLSWFCGNLTVTRRLSGSHCSFSSQALKDRY